MSRKKRPSTINVVFVVVILFGYPARQGIAASPEQSLKEFYSSQGAEDQLMDPLILAGVSVVPLLLDEVANKEMPRRRYAIGALGNIQDRSALAVLEDILGDTSEKDYFRCDALNALGMIDFQRAKKISEMYRQSKVICLSQLSDEMLTTDQKAWLDSNYMRRTFQDAQVGRHE